MCSGFRHVNNLVIAQHIIAHDAMTNFSAQQHLPAPFRKELKFAFTENFDVFRQSEAKLL